MKLKRDDITRSQDTSPLHLFQQGIRAEATRRTYTRTLRRVMCDILEDVLEGDLERRVKQFVQRARDDPGWTLDLLLSLAWKLRKRTELPKDHADYLNPTSIPPHFMPIKKLLDMNSVSIPWGRVYATFPERDNILDTKGWTREEVASMLVHARDPMDRAIVLLLASSGVRLGGLNLTWGDLTTIYIENGRLTTDPDGGSGEVACVALNVYAGSPEQYTTFVTPEAYNAIMQYGRMWADIMLRQPGPKDPLFVATKRLPLRRASEQAIAKRVRRMATKAGLREPSSSSGTGTGKRYETQLMHGFRKLFNKTCKEVLSGDSLASLIRVEYMMGHKGLVPLDQNYFKTDMLELAAVYVKAVLALTIDDSEWLKQSNKRMSDNIQSMEDKKDGKIARLEGQIQSMEEKMSKIGDRGGATADEILNAVLKSPKSGGVPGEVVESFTAMMDQLGAAQETAMRDMKAVHDAEMADMKAEYDAKMERMMRVIDRMARESDAGHDSPAGSGEDGPGMERRGHDQS